jgi:hypothetical protein
MKNFLLTVCLLSTTTAWGANFSGKWLLPGSRGFGAFGKVILVLNQTGNDLHGTVTGFGDMSSGSPVYTEVLDAKVEGDTVSFYIWRGSDEPQKWFFKGTLSGTDEIVFQVTHDPERRSAAGEGGPSVPPVSKQITAKRTE